MCVHVRVHTLGYTPKGEDEMSRHMWLPCIQHDLANLPGHVPQSLTVIILASPGLGAAGNLRGRKRSTRRRKSLRWLSLSCKLALSAAVNHMNVSECCNAKFSDMMISYDRFCILVCFLHRDCTLWPAARGRAVQPTERRRRRQCLPPCGAKTFQRLPT